LKPSAKLRPVEDDMSVDDPRIIIALNARMTQKVIVEGFILAKIFGKDSEIDRMIGTDVVLFRNWSWRPFL